MNHFADASSNVWDDDLSTGDSLPNPTSSTLLNASQNTYSNPYTFDNDDNFEDNNPYASSDKDNRDVETEDDKPLTEVNFMSPALNPYGEDIDNDRIQNELAHTMRSILINDPKAEVDDVDEEGEQENNANKDQTIGESHSPTKDEIQTLKAKKNQILSSLIPDDIDSTTFLKDSILEESNPKPGESMFSSITNDDGALGNLLSMTADTETESAPLDSISTHAHVTSPNRKVKMLRPRRSTRGSAKKNGSLAPKTTKDSTPLDPLSAPSLNNESQSKPEAEFLGASPKTRKQELINSIDEPLFNLKKANVLRKSSPNSASTNLDSERSIEPTTPTKTNYKPREKGEDFDITVGDPIKVGDLTTAHVVYTITTKTKCDLFKTVETVVTRRYSDFLWLYHQLLNGHPGFIIPPPPEKQAYGRFDEKFIENRRLALEKMLTKISNRIELQKDFDFILFLQSPNFSVESKERETLIFHGDADSSKIQDPNYDASMSQIINSTASMAENSSSGGFFSSLIGLSTPKYVENDQFILEKQAYVDNLDHQLRSLSKSLDMILEKRDELIISLDEVVTVIGQMADLEVNVEITEILTNFEDLQKKIKELLERSNTSQILTLGSTVDEYIRIIGSVRNCFENRLKICTSVATLESSQSKKEKYLIKFKSKNHNQRDKYKRFEDELDKLSDTISKQVTFKEDFNKNFRTELERFEFEKIIEFKNMVEIYWETLIENQKQLIELWETFYEKCRFDKG